MEILVHVPHIPHTMGKGNGCPYHYYYQYNQEIVPVWALFLFWTIVVLVVLKVVMYINDKLDKDD